MTDADPDARMRPVPVRVVIADDEALIRAGFRALLDAAADMAVVGEAATGAQAVRQARALAPDVVLMDIRMPVMDGLEATEHLANTPTVRVLIVTTFDQDEHVFAALRAGASGFVLKDSPPEQLLDAIRVIAAGEALLAPNITRRLIAAFARQPPPTAQQALAGITDREREVLIQVAAGRSNTEIAHELTVTTATVKTHVSRLLAKLDARDRAQLVVIAYETGLVQPRRGADPRQAR